MVVDKLKQLDEFQGTDINIRVVLTDGSTIVCKPEWWSEEEFELAYSVELISKWDKYPAGTNITLFNGDIDRVEAIQ